MSLPDAHKPNYTEILGITLTPAHVDQLFAIKGMAEYLPNSAYKRLRYIAALRWLYLSFHGKHNLVLELRLREPRHSHRDPEGRFRSVQASAVTMTLESADLLCYHGPTEGTRDIVETSLALPAKRRPLHFGAAPHGMQLNYRKEPEYFTPTDPDRLVLKYGMLRPHDIHMPMLCGIHPSGDVGIKDIAFLLDPAEKSSSANQYTTSTGVRPLLLSFIGSVHRPEDLNDSSQLGRARSRGLEALATVQNKFFEKGVAGLTDSELIGLVTSGSDGSMPLPLKDKVLFAASATNFRQSTPGQVEIALNCSRGLPPQGIEAREFFNPQCALFALATDLASQFCYTPAGDGPVRQTIPECIIMGAIPVIHRWQADILAGYFGGILFKSIVRFEDVFVIVESDEWVAKNPEKLLAMLLKQVVNGEAAARRKRLLLIADYFTWRLDWGKPDSVTLLLGILHDRKQKLQAGVPIHVDRPPMWW